MATAVAARGLKNVKETVYEWEGRDKNGKVMRGEMRAVASLFSPGGTHALKGEFAGINDFEVVAFLVILPEAGTA